VSSLKTVSTYDKNIYYFSLKRCNLKAAAEWISEIVSKGIVLTNHITLAEELHDDVNLQEISFVGYPGKNPEDQTIKTTIDKDSLMLGIEIDEKDLKGKHKVTFTGFIGTYEIGIVVNLINFNVSVSLTKDADIYEEELEHALLLA